MWLLSTDRAELRFFSSLEEAQRTGYAILSHVWGDAEQTFQETQALRTAGRHEDGYNPRDQSTAKVREGCKLAETHGYKWIWNDTCCIDKTSSSELSEAINSMFSYYAYAEVCYAYLGDVPADSPVQLYATPFSRSRWFERGWTLQELIAPAQVVLLSSSWSILGTKAEHAELLSQITRIPEAILTFQKEIWDASIAARMSWASWRKTTRSEDEAYSLMGIFDVQMPTIYGEGRNAFRRLQEEIMRKSIDTTLFAWGEPANNFLPDCAQLRPFESHHHDSKMYLLATSPRDFLYSGDYTFAPRVSRASGKTSLQHFLRRVVMSPSSSRSPLPDCPSFEATPYGVHARMSVVKVLGFAIAVLFTSNNHGDPLGLLLARSWTGGGSTLPLYHPCITTVSGSMHRLVNIGFILRQSPKLQHRFDSAPWSEFHLTHVRPKPLVAVDRNILHLGTTSPFHIPSWLLPRLRAARIYAELHPKELGVPWDGATPVTLVAYHPHAKEVLSLSFGRCVQDARLPRSGARTRTLWVSIHYGGAMKKGSEKSHDCFTDHFAQGVPRSKTVTYLARYRGRTLRIRLVFAPYPLSPTQTYALTEMEWEDESRTVPVFTTAST